MSKSGRRKREKRSGRSNGSWRRDDPSAYVQTGGRIEQAHGIIPVRLQFRYSLSVVTLAAAGGAAGTGTSAAAAAGVLSLLLLIDEIADNGDDNGQ